ncbi:SRPBCC domain-containing protein [Ornithinimicrobium sp. LYQ103]|uniref:SRPBCC domain-containing protein n=1 Tax=Ornithinimicrobium sp. LYQ103 TaxID=3378796 RepID=UPI0038543302
MLTGSRQTRDGTDHLVLTRRLGAPVEDVWAAITRSGRLALWFCTWTGDPTTGRVEVRWVFEEDMPGEAYVIDACEEPRHLRVRSVADDPTQVWTLDARLDSADGVTTLTFAQVLTEDVDVREVGPGWEYYLDRLEESVRTGEVSTVAWEDYEALAEEYAVLAQG